MPKPGERWLVWFKRFVNWSRQFRLISADPRIRMNVIPGHGTLISADVEGNGYVGAFPCSLMNETEAIVGEGYVNNLIATIDGIGLDGKDKNGNEVDVPKVKLDGGPNEKLRSWLCVQVEIDPKTRQMLDPKEHENVITIIHTNALDPGHKDGGSPDQNHLGREPIAVIKWGDGATPVAIHQHALHDLHHRFVPGLKSARGRHFFWV